MAVQMTDYYYLDIPYCPRHFHSVDINASKTMPTCSDWVNFCELLITVCSTLVLLPNTDLLSDLLFFDAFQRPSVYHLFVNRRGTPFWRILAHARKHLPYFPEFRQLLQKSSRLRPISRSVRHLSLYCSSKNSTRWKVPHRNLWS